MLCGLWLKRQTYKRLLAPDVRSICDSCQRGAHCKVMCKWAEMPVGGYFDHYRVSTIVQYFRDFESFKQYFAIKLMALFMFVIVIVQLLK